MNGGGDGALLIAQFSDLHVTAPGARNAFGIDSAAGLRRCIDHLQALRRVPDLLLLSGDLTDNGVGAEYEALRELLAPLRMPYHLLAGNHDRRDALRAVFAGHPGIGNNGPICHALDLPGLRIVMLDSLVEGRDDGDLDQDQLGWLEQALDAVPAIPALVVLHHPPVSSGYSVMDRIALAPQAAQRLGKIIAAKPAVQAVLCGHLHRPLQARWQGAAVAVAPSTAFQVQLRFGGGRFEPDLNAAPSYLLHYWNGRSLVTHLATA